MQTEELKEAIEGPVTELQADSKESKSNRGGRRPGAGRKPNPTKLLRGVSRETLAVAVANIDIATVLAGLLRSNREIIRLQVLKFVYDRMLGKPKQDVSVSGGLVHAHTRDPFLASLPKEALEELARAYDAVLVVISALRGTTSVETSHATALSAMVGGLIEAFFSPITWLVIVIAFVAATWVTRKTSKRAES